MAKRLREVPMNRACWTLFAISVVLLLSSVYSKVMGPGHFLCGYTAVSWWRVSMAVVIYAMALKIIGHEHRAAV
jgi:hypothetical protein